MPKTLGRQRVVLKAPSDKQAHVGLVLQEWHEDGRCQMRITNFLQTTPCGVDNWYDMPEDRDFVDVCMDMAVLNGWTIDNGRDEPVPADLMS